MNKNTKLASHNSWSYLKPKSIWMRPFAFMARCQEATIESQWMHGVTCFDLRVRFEEDGTPYFCHGLIKYDGDVMLHLKKLDETVGRWGNKAHVRVILEDNMFTFDINEQVSHFFDFAAEIDKNFPNLQMFGGWTKSEWRNCQIYTFKTKEPKIVEKHSSVSGYGKSFRALWPKLYALRNNRRFFYSTDYEADYLMLDFINRIFVWR